MIEKVLDEYEIKARMAPAMIIILPVVIGGLYAAPVLSSWSVFATGGIFCLVLIYGLSYLVRVRGDSIEPALWTSWGGAPSTRFLRHHDLSLSKQTKSRIRIELERRFSARLVSEDEERREPSRADRVISDAFREVRQYIRLHDSKGLWSKQNAEYGFSRNLLGCRVLWLITAFASALFTAINGWRSGAGVLNPATALELALTSVAAYAGWKFLPQVTRRVADGYAEAAWIAFLHSSEEGEESKQICPHHGPTGCD
jgi:hypothetical protein